MSWVASGVLKQSKSREKTDSSGCFFCLFVSSNFPYNFEVSTVEKVILDELYQYSTVVVVPCYYDVDPLSFSVERHFEFKISCRYDS